MMPELRALSRPLCIGLTLVAGIPVLGTLPSGNAAMAQAAPHAGAGAQGGATQMAPHGAMPMPMHKGGAAMTPGMATPVSGPAGTGQAGNQVAQSADTAGTADDAQGSSDDRVPVFAITGIEVLHSKLKPGLDMVVVSGLTSSDGWSNAELVPLTRTMPSDNVLNLVLVASPPAESMAPTGYGPLFAMLPLPPDHPFKAIRVRGATNSVLLKDLAGSVEVPPPPEPCTLCVGRYFVATGQAAPSGVPADKVLRQDSLPPNARVIRPEDGIGDVQRNPDRLTIVVGEDGRVVDAVWE